MATFWEKYKDPRWQKRRLEIMSAAGWQCQNCGDKGTTLNVHHKRYRKGADPWDYEDSLLQCLCEVCHEEEHAERELLTRLVTECEAGRLENIIGLVAGYLDCNLDIEPPLAWAGREAGREFYEIGMAASILQSWGPAAWRGVIETYAQDHSVTPTVDSLLAEWSAQEPDPGAEK